MKLCYLMLAALLSSATFAASTISKDTVDVPSHRFAIQGAIATGGAIGLGIADYSESTEIGLTVSGTRNNASASTNNVTPVIFAGLRYALRDQTYFAWGVDLADTFGTSNGGHLDAAYQVGPYISLEQMLTNHFMLAGWIEPYQFQYEKISGTSVTTHDFFGAGGLAINYLF